MLEHHIQRSIVSRLSTADSLRFSELKPEELENKAFDYHLKLLIRDKLVVKNEDGGYQLTPFGRKMGNSVGLAMSEKVNRAYSTLFLIIRQNKKWLLYKRLTHPLINKVGFMHAKPNARETIRETAGSAVKEKASLDVNFTVRAHGYFRVYDRENLESFTHFTLLVCEDAKGELRPNDEFAEYSWHENPDFKAPDMLPNMADIVDLYNDPKRTFLEKTYQL